MDEKSETRSAPSRLPVGATLKRMRLDISALGRRQVLLRTLATIGSVSVPWSRPATLPVSAAKYTVVPTGAIADKQVRLAEVEKQFALTPDDPYVFGEKAQLESDIQALGTNKAFAAGIARDTAAGTRTFVQGLRVGVPDMEAALQFWTMGCGALVVGTRMEGGANVTTVSYGPQSLQREDGAKFALELVETQKPNTFEEATSVLQYVQLAIPVFRLSQVMASGGEIVSAYGWTSVIAPGGLPLRVRIDETRRDPFEFVALRTSNLKSAATYYEGTLGMTKLEEKSAVRKLRFTVNSNSIFEDSDANEPDREAGSILLGYDDPALTTGVLLLPPKARKGPLNLGRVTPQLRFVGSGKAAEPGARAEMVGPDGVPTLFMPPIQFEQAVQQA